MPVTGSRRPAKSAVKLPVSKSWLVPERPWEKVVLSLVWVICLAKFVSIILVNEPVSTMKSAGLLLLMTVGMIIR